MNTIDNYNFSGKRAIVRVDFNVPLNDSFEVTDDTRIKAAIPTLKKILERGGSVVIMSHLGRPSGASDRYSLRHILPVVEKRLGVKIKFAPDCMGREAEELAATLKSGEVLMLENLRFYGEEEGKVDSTEFTKRLASYADCYVNDAFGTAHRAHASTALIARYFPNDKMFGYLMESEIKALSRVLNSPSKPMTAIIGGAKISSKLAIIERLFDVVDNMIIGGGMAFTFEKARGGDIGNSICEDDLMETARETLRKAEERGVKIYLPLDAVIADKFGNDATVRECKSSEIPDGWMGLDTGAEALKEWREVILNSKTILWNGPVGVFELERFASGTKQVAEMVVSATQKGAFSLIGGGDSVAAVSQMGFDDKVSYLSTGGGAMLEYLEGSVLPGIKAIED